MMMSRDSFWYSCRPLGAGPVLSCGGHHLSLVRPLMASFTWPTSTAISIWILDSCFRTASSGLESTMASRSVMVELYCPCSGSLLSLETRLSGSSSPMRCLAKCSCHNHWLSMAGDGRQMSSVSGLSMTLLLSCEAWQRATTFSIPPIIFGGTLSAWALNTGALLTTLKEPFASSTYSHPYQMAAQRSSQMALLKETPLQRRTSTLPAKSISFTQAGSLGAPSAPLLSVSSLRSVIRRVIRAGLTWKDSFGSLALARRRGRVGCWKRP
mmetsp:Transcript_24510/g.68224  ORF Transcript_24510/g.68224 Transcript_24510/m.68224 type:complete len:268 (-) Transcript_24510:2513-3316(-)